MIEKRNGREEVKQCMKSAYRFNEMNAKKLGSEESLHAKNRKET
jgi:hypothetical protein